jgi:glucuronate isomerase
MSFTRHEYFRRILCDIFGRDMENGEVPNDDAYVGEMISNICYNNAKQYLGLEIC